MVVGSRKLLHLLIIVVILIYSILLVTTFSKFLSYIVIFFVSIATVYGLARFFKLHVGTFTVITSLILVLISIYTLLTINIFYLYYYLIGLAAALSSVFIIGKYTRIQFKKHHRVDIALIASVIIYGLLITQYLTAQIIGTELKFADNLTLSASTDLNYTWYPENKGKLNSLSLSGRLSTNGKVKVYLVSEDEKISYLILDSESVKSKKSPSAQPTLVETRAAQTSEPSTPTPSQEATIESSITPSPEITSHTASPTPTESLVTETPSPIVEPTLSPESTPEPTQTESAAPVTESTSLTETTISASSNLRGLSFSKLKLQDATESPVIDQPSPTPEIIPTIEPSPTEILVTESLTPTSLPQETTPTVSPEVTQSPSIEPSTIEIVSPSPLSTETTIPTTQPVETEGFITFQNFCLDTCNLPDLKEKKYTIKIEIEGDGEIILNSVDYTILKKTKTISIAVKDSKGKQFGEYNITERKDGKFDLELDLNETEVPEKKEFDITALAIAEPTQPNLSQKFDVQIKGLVDPPLQIEAVVDSVSDPQISTDAFAMEPLEFDNATITLPKNGRVDKIFSCADFDINYFECPRWEKTNIPFVDNGDTITFTVTHFSGYAGGIINITKAEHLDTSRIFISDIFNETRYLDSVWSEQIPENHYIRATFEQVLDSTKDITLYVRNNQSLNTSIDVLYTGTSNKITSFPIITSEGYYKVLLTNLVGTNDTFDLKIVNTDPDSAYLEFDHIVDPNNAPNAPTLNSPQNASTSTDTFRLLNITVTDPDGDAMNVSIYGDNSTGTNLLYFAQDVANGTTLTYNFTSPTIGSIYSNDASLVGYFKFDSFSGTTIYDSSTQANNATLRNEANINLTGGYFAGAGIFDGSSSYSDYADSVSNFAISGQTLRTVVAWVMVRDTSDTDSIVSWGGTATGADFRPILRPASDQLQLACQSCNRIWTFTNNINEWHMIAVVMNGTSSSNLLGFGDGQPLSVASTASATINTAASKLYIGVRNDVSGASAFNGKIDELAIFNRTLSATEIANLYNLTSGTYYWKAEANDSTLSTTSATNQFTVGNGAPNVTLNSPANATTSADTYRLLNITVTDLDTDNDLMNVSIYGDNSTATELISYFENVANGTTLTYNWTAPTVGSAFSGDTSLLYYLKGDVNASDVSSYANGGTLAGNAFINRTSGYFGGAAQFDGTGDFINVSDVSAIDTATTLSSCAWVNLTGTFTTDDVIWVKSATTTDGVIFFRDDVGSVSGRTDIYTIFIADSASTASTRVESATNAAQANKWTHVCFTFQTGSATGLRLYVNGVEDANSPASTSSISAINAGANNLYIGQNFGTAGQEPNGKIDDLAIWNRTLSASEILDLYRLKNSTYYWKADANDGINTTTSETRQFLVGLAPSVSLNSPANGETVTASPIAFNFTPTAGTNSLSSCTLYHNNTGTFAANQSTTVLTSGQQTNITIPVANGNYTWNVQCADSTGISAFASANRTVNVNIAQGGDSTAPTVTFVDPTPNSGTNQSSTSATINVTSVDASSNVDVCVLEWAGVNESMTKVGSGTSVSCNKAKSSLSDGTYSFKVFSNDTAGNMGVSATRTITIDATSPSSLSFVSPTQNDGTNLSRSFYEVNLTFTETNPNNCLFDDGSNTSMTRVGSSCFINRTSQSDGTKTYRVWVNDTASNIAVSSTRTIKIDTTKPSVNSPQVNVTGSISVTTPIQINITATDVNGISLVKVGNTTNVTMSLIGSNKYQASTTPNSLGCSADQATCLLTFNVNDTAGNLNSTTTLTLNIFGCGQTLTSSSTLTSSLTSAGTCFTFGADNLLINGNGKSITGNSQGAAFSVGSSANITIANLTISNFATDVSVTTGSVSLVNTTFTRSKTTVSGSGNITAKWYADNVVREWSYENFEGSSGTSGYCGDARCGSGEDQYNCYQDCSGSSSESCGNNFCGSNETSNNCPADCSVTQSTPPGISGANLTIYDVFGNRLYSILTSLNGQIPRIELTEFIQRSAGKTLYTTHSINISKVGYSKFGRLLNLTSTGTISLSHVLNKPFANCDSYNGNQTQCTAAKCSWENDTSLCKPASTSLDCDQFCGKCITEPTCTASTRSCQWTSSGSGGYCNENFSTFTYGTGGTTNSSGYFNFIPVDCMKEPQNCDSRFDVDKGYYKFETLCSDTIDNDEDGSADCSDTDCIIWPACSASYNASADSTPPKITNSKTDLDNNSTSITTTTTEPTTFTVKYYGTNSACASNPTLVNERNLANCSLDDYSVWHHVNLDSSVGITLNANSTYYYKINGTDKAGLSYETGCLNFTTKSSAQNFNFRAFVPGEYVKIKPPNSDSFTNYNFTSSASEFTNYKGAEMRFEGHGVTFKNIDISSSKSLNFTNAFVSGNRSLFGSKFQGINSSNWLETSQSLGLAASDNVSLTIESTGNRIYKCDDNGGNCTQLTECYWVTSSNATHTTIELAAAAGFSAYTVADNAQLLTWDQTDSNSSLYDASGASKTTSDTVTFYANYSNTTSGAPINITGSYCEFNTTGVSSTNMTYSASRGLYSYSTSISTAATHSWTVRCFGNSVFDDLNATDNITIGSAPSTSTTTTGGGGGGTTSPTPTVSATPTTTPQPEKPINFTLNKDLIKVSLRQGQSEKISFIINNNGRQAESEISTIGDNGSVFLDTEKLTLNPSEGYEIKGSISVSESTTPGVYTSKIKVSAEGIEKIINVVVEVNTKRALFDVRLDLPPDQRSVGVGSTEVTPLITLINIGDLEKVDVVLRYVIKDSENNIISETIETKGIEKQLSFTRDIQLPASLEPNSYVAYVEVTYQNAVAVASQLFRIEKGAKTRTIEPYSYLLVVAIIIIVVVGFVALKFKGGKRSRRRK